MGCMDELRDRLIEAAQEPKKVTGDTGSVEAHSLKDIREADEYITKTQAATNTRRGLRFNKMISPGP